MVTPALRRELVAWAQDAYQLTERRACRRKSVAARPAHAPTTGPNQRWAMDVVHDVLASGEKVRVLTVIDLHRRECVALTARHRFGGEDVADVLGAAARERGGLPPAIKVDQGTEFTSVALDRWAYFHKVELAFSRPGTPGDNAHCEAFNGTLRREVLSQPWFASLTEAQHVLDAWRDEYNNERPHKSLQHEPPAHWATGGHYVPSRARLSG